MNTKALLIVCVALLGVLVAAISGLYLTRQPQVSYWRDVKVLKYSEVVRDYLKLYDTDGDGRLSQAEFREAYDKAKLELFQTLDVVEAFKRLDANKDGVLSEADAAIFESGEKMQDRVKQKERDAEQGLVEIEIDGLKVKANPHQREWILAELAAFKQEQLPYAGTFFEKRYLQRYGRVRFSDGKLAEGFIREGDGSQAAMDDKLAANRVYVLGYDRKLLTHDRARVSGIDYLDEHFAMSYIKRLRSARLSDAALQLELARDCLKQGMKEDAITLFRRVLIFQHDNAEALSALGLRLDGKLFVAVN